MPSEQKIKVDENGVTFRCPSCTRRVMSPHEIIGMRMQCPKCGDNIPTPSDTHPDYLAWQQEQKEEKKASQQQAREEKAVSRRKKKKLVKKSSKGSSSIMDDDQDLDSGASDEARKAPPGFSVKTHEAAQQSRMEDDIAIRPAPGEYSPRRVKAGPSNALMIVMIVLLLGVLGFQVEAFIRSFKALDQSAYEELKVKTDQLQTVALQQGKFEYRIQFLKDPQFEGDTAHSKQLQSLGEEGWEIINARRAMDEEIPGYEFVLKRHSQSE